MGDLILCTHPTASKPFEVALSHLNLYSIEELCYYLEENLTILDESFFTEELCDWISQELDFPDLADALWSQMMRKGTVSDCVRLIFDMSGCYLPKEQEEVEQALERIRGKSLLERRILKIDHQLENRYYSSCIREYEKLLGASEAIPMPGELKGRLYHNLGVAYAGMFLFTEAAGCFATAYKWNKKEESKTCYFYALQFIPSDQQTGGEELEADFDELIRYKDDFNRVEAEMSRNGQRKVFQDAAEKQTSLEKRELLLNLLSEWKKNYRQM